MSIYTPIPALLVAPNGARKTKVDHPMVPITIAETVAVAAACFEAGAGGLHAHVRDAEGAHVLDAGLYSELLAEMARVVPDMVAQITTEAVGRYTAVEQRALVAAVQPRHVSVGLREMLSDGDTAAATRFYRDAVEAGCRVQHILYHLDDIAAMRQAIADGIVPAEDLEILLVLGRYSDGQQSNPNELDEMVAALNAYDTSPAWGLCAFGVAETDCLIRAHRMGGKMRVGFENSLQMRDGSIAADNAERVREVVGLMRRSE
jgi:uncharacterized protein (DUF849 family)